MAIKKQVTIEAIGDVSKAIADIRKLKEEIQGLGGGQSSSSGLGVVSKGAAGAALSITALNQGLELTKKLLGSVHTAMEFFIADFRKLEQRAIAFNTIAGSIGLGKELFQSLKNLATESPISLFEAFEGAEKLLAFGIDPRQIKEDLLALGNIAAGVGKDKLGRLILAFGQVKTAAQLTGQELRQFAEAGVPLLDELAKASSRSAAKVKEDMFKGLKPTFEEVQNAIRGMSEEGGKFHNLLQEQAKTIAGLEQIASDRFAIVKSEIGEITGLTGLWKNALVKVNDLLKSISDWHLTPEERLSMESDKYKGSANKSAANFVSSITGIDFSKNGKEELKTATEAASDIYKLSAEKISKTLEEVAKKRLENEKEAKDREENLGKDNFGTAKAIAPWLAEAQAYANWEKELQIQLAKVRSEGTNVVEMKFIRDHLRLKGMTLEQLSEELKLGKELESSMETRLLKRQAAYDSDKRFNEDEQKKIKRLKDELEYRQKLNKLIKDEFTDKYKNSSVTVYGNPFLRPDDYENKGVQENLKNLRIMRDEALKINRDITLSAEEKNERIRVLNDQLAEAQKITYVQMGEGIIGSFERITKVFGSKSKEWFEVSKALGIAKALISTYVGINKALELPTPLNWIEVAAVSAEGFANVAAIESLRFGGGTSKKSSSSASSIRGLHTTSEDRSTFEDMSRRADINGVDKMDKLINLIEFQNEILNETRMAM